MRVLIVRHAKAEDLAAETDADDRNRPLTGGGRKQARKTGAALRNFVPRIDVLATSPLVRARDTAQIVARAYKHLRPVELPALAPGSAPDAVVAWLAQQPTDATVGLIGHEPDLSALASFLLTGHSRPLLALKKGAACLVDFDATPQPAHGRLVWLLTPRQLRGLAD